MCTLEHTNSLGGSQNNSVKVLAKFWFCVSEMLNVCLRHRDLPYSNFNKLTTMSVKTYHCPCLEYIYQLYMKNGRICKMHL